MNGGVFELEDDNGYCHLNGVNGVGGVNGMNGIADVDSGDGSIRIIRLDQGYNCEIGMWPTVSYLRSK